MERAHARGPAFNAKDLVPSHSDLDDTRKSAEGLSVKERMALYKKDLSAVDERAEARTAWHKKGRGLEGVKVDGSAKSSIAAAFSKRIAMHKAGTLGGDYRSKAGGSEGDGDGLSGLVLASDRRQAAAVSGTTADRTAGLTGKRRRRGKRTVIADVLFGEAADAEIVEVSAKDAPKSDDHGKFIESEEKSLSEGPSVIGAAPPKETTAALSKTRSMGKRAPKRTMNEVLLSAEREDATAITKSMGFVTVESAPIVKGRSSATATAKVKSDTVVFNMNNNTSLTRMTADQRTKMVELISYSIVDTPGISQVKMCNANVDDEMMIAILKL